MTKPSAFYFSMQFVLKEYGKRGISVIFQRHSGAHPLAATPFDKLILLHCSQEANSSAQAAKTQTLYTIRASYSGPAVAKKGLVAHLARWLFATSSLLPELFPETRNLCAPLLPVWFDAGIAATSKAASVLSVWGEFRFCG